MNRFRFSILLLAVLALATASIAEEGWLANLDEALQAAKKDNKKVLVDFTATWCGWCTKLKEDVFSKQEFKDYTADKLVLVAIDADQNKDLVEKYNVQGFPTIMVLDAEGKEVHKLVGYKPLDKFLEELKTVETAK